MNVNPPPPLLALTDGARAVGDAAILHLAAPLLRRMPKAHRQRSVMVIPGFLGDDRGNGLLIRHLRHLGYRVSGWKQGRNLGPNSFNEDSLRAAMEPLIEAGGGKVSLVGHSLGGIYAREIARSEPDRVRQVITLGSPFGSGHAQASNASWLYNRLNPEPNHRDLDDILSIPPPVPTTAIYTKADGIVNWRTSVQQGNYPNVHNVEVRGSHIGLNVNTAVWYWIARKLSQT